MTKAHALKLIHESEMKVLALKESSEKIFDLMKEEVYKNETLVDENIKLREALENLVQLKDWKDKHGKDEHYLINQPRAWGRAKELLNPSEVK